MPTAFVTRAWDGLGRAMFVRPLSCERGAGSCLWTVVLGSGSVVLETATASRRC